MKDHFDLLVLFFGLRPTELASSDCQLHLMSPLKTLPGQGLLARALRCGEEGPIGGAADVRRPNAIHLQI